MFRCGFRIFDKHKHCLYNLLNDLTKDKEQGKALFYPNLSAFQYLAFRITLSDAQESVVEIPLKRIWSSVRQQVGKLHNRISSHPVYKISHHISWFLDPLWNAQCPYWGRAIFQTHHNIPISVFWSKRSLNRNEMHFHFHYKPVEQKSVLLRLRGGCCCDVLPPFSPHSLFLPPPLKSQLRRWEGAANHPIMPLLCRWYTPY